MNDTARFLGLILAILWSCSSWADEPPNFVILLADDAGYADFGFQPDVMAEMRELTPHIDSIAADGVRFSNAYVSGSVCSPSRAGMMTGRYQQRFGHDNNIPPGYMDGGLPLDEAFGAKRLGEFGYTTGLVGKWHLGYPDDYQPNQRGFDWFYGCLQGSRSYFPIDNPSPHRVFQENKEPTEEGGYVTDRIGDGACRFITENHDKPFYLFVSFTAPHGPLQAKPEDLEALSGIERERRRKYAGLIKSMDDNVGKVLSCLDELGLADNTLVIFSNDNGGQTQTGANNYPLRGRKGMLWEGGIRVPMAMRWPDRIAAGSVIDDPVITLDWLPTFVEAAEQTMDPAWELDGISLLDRITGETTQLPERTLFWRRRGSEGAIAARRGHWKMIHNRQDEGSAPELYSLESDIGEARNVADGNPEIVRQLVGEVEEWESGLSEPQWTPRSPNRPPARQGSRKKKQ
ncbi:MAG: sulfatase [Pirellulaceae bacterium]